MLIQKFWQVLSKIGQENLLLSPLSASLALAFAESGAEGRTASELKQILGFPTNSTAIEQSIAATLSQLQNDDQLYHLSIANKIYVKENFPIKETFKNSSLQTYQAEAQNINFNEKETAANQINQWVEEKTENKIKNLISSDVFNNRTRLVLVNALYLQANWSTPFDEVSKKIFYSQPGKAIMVDTMLLSDESFKYHEDLQLKAKFLELPLDGGDVSMTIVLPMSHYGLYSLEARIEEVLAPHPYQNEVVNLALPKFKIESKIDLKSILRNLGVHTPFDEYRADFSKIVEKGRNVFIGDMVQKTYLKCDENGIEGAAATYIGKIIAHKKCLFYQIFFSF